MAKKRKTGRRNTDIIVRNEWERGVDAGKKRGEQNGSMGERGLVKGE